MNLDDQMTQCQYSYCKQRDFLPFLCSLCKMKYCLEHKDPKDHECNREPTSKKAINCPQCKKTIYYLSTKTEEQVLKSHLCEEIKDEKIERCFRCNLKLTLTNSYVCKHCHKQVCLKHRFQDDHNCHIVVINNHTRCCYIM